MLARKLLEAAGNAGGGSLYVEDVFSTYLYEGKAGNQTITNGIDFSGVGGLVWLKNRVSSGTNNVLLDTERGGGKFLYSNSSDQELDFTGVFGVTFNNNGFTLLDTYTGYNTAGEAAVSWSFRKAKNFFDVVTYTGNGTAGRTVSHNLGSVPGCVIVKSLGANNWQAYHNGLTSAAYSIWLNSTSVEVSAPTVWNSTAPTSTVFTVGSSGLVNNSGTSYVAYVFASDAGGFGDDGDESIIKCGSFTTDGTQTAEVTGLGWEPQYVLFKNVNLGNNWQIHDSMRGMPWGSYTYLAANSSNAEVSGAAPVISPTPDGFLVNNANYNQKSIYIAIRRPMKTPESGTEVFLPYSTNPTSVDTQYTTGFPIDMVICGQKNSNNSSDNWTFVDRLRGFTANSNTDGANTKLLLSTSLDPETTQTYPDFYNLWNTGAKQGYGLNGVSVTYQFFRRATGFMDVVAYTGNGVNNSAKPHNLGVEPELIIFKNRGVTLDWCAYVKYLDATAPWNYKVFPNDTRARDTDMGVFGNQLPTATNFYTAGNNSFVNVSGNNYIAYLFATLAGVSKVGSYTGTAATLNVDCGFSAGARFILIKRTNSTGGWYVYDSARGIVTGNDPYFLLDSIAAEVTNTDYIDPLSSGFTVTSTAPAGLNASGGTYIFLAIA